jgi:hypothetical protein
MDSLKLLIVRKLQHWRHTAAFDEMNQQVLAVNIKLMEGRPVSDQHKGIGWFYFFYPNPKICHTPASNFRRFHSKISSVY